MTRILLINPNSSHGTTDMMVRIAQSAAGDDIEIIGATANDSAPMIVTEVALAASVAGVTEIGMRLGGDVSGIIVSAFGDPGLTELRGMVGIPVVGIAEAAMLEAARDGRRFGIATTTPGLAAAIGARTADLGLGHLYTGIRLTPDDPFELISDPDRLADELGKAVSACVDLHGAKAVIIGGGPLGNAATALAVRFDIPVIAPIPAAVRHILRRLNLLKPISPAV